MTLFSISASFSGFSISEFLPRILSLSNLRLVRNRRIARPLDRREGTCDHAL